MRQPQQDRMQPVPKRASRTHDYPPVQTFTPSSAGRHLEEEDRDRAESDLDELDEPAYPRSHTSVIRYTAPKGQRQQVIQRGNQRIAIHEGKPKGRYPWPLLICIGMFVALLLVYAWNTVGNWWVDYQLETTYGFPRTYQTDAIVYPGDSAAHPSHYIFLNLNGTVEIIELPHSDSANAKIYQGPTLVMDNADLVAITGEFKQVNGKEEMIVHIGNQQIIYVNNGQKFVPQQ